MIAEAAENKESVGHMTAASHVTPPQQIGIGKRRLRAKTSVKYQQTVQTEEL